MIIKCEVDPASRPTSTDHYPILTHILLPQERINAPLAYNFRDVDWDKYKKTLRNKLSQTTDEPIITNTEQLNEAVRCLTTAIQETTQEMVKRSKPRPDAKRWWSGDLNRMKKDLNRLRKDSYSNRAIANHPSHRELKTKSNKYGEAIIQAKRQHWTSYLEDMTASDIWTANKYIKEPIGDGGSPRIPTLRFKDETGADVAINDNEDKATTFAKIFFPPPPPPEEEAANYEYPEPLPDPQQISLEQLQRNISRLSPYKAHGPDGIPNIVLQRCSELITNRLLLIFRAIIELNIYYDPWREFTSVVLRKPGKPSYIVPKAYRPVVLLATMAKVLTSIVAENISLLVETYQLLPKTHFGGRPGRTTTDAIHYLIHKIKSAWREGQVASILFLDVEGAFPNAVTSKLIHNLRKRRIPVALVKFVAQLLSNRRTKIRFDDYTSGPIEITNGIGQGDPLSMLLYILYNADLLEIPDNESKEDAIGYVDDIAILATGDTFEETTQRLETLMTKEDGGLQWSRTHNSKFEVSKSVIMHFTRKTDRDPETDNGRIPLTRPQLVLEGKIVKETECFKYLGVLVDSQLRWNEQAQRAIANATKWILQYKRLTRTATGVSSKLMRQLYLAVALPKITYGLDIWYTPPSKPAGQTKNSGSVGTLRSLQKTQRLASTSITGTFRSAPTDLIDAHAGILPMELALRKASHRAIVRMLTLPDTHPLQQIIKRAKRHPPEKHPSPIDNLIKIFKLENSKLEIITRIPANANLVTRYTTSIAKSRKESIKAERNDTADFKIFSDGSGQEDGIGAAAIMYKRGSNRPVKSLKKYIGPPTKNNTYEAEAVGAIIAMWIAGNTMETWGKEVSLYIDNQAVIYALSSRNATAGQHLIKSFRNAANSLHCNLTIRWISSHSDVKGNEEADRLAKEAAAGRSSRRVDLPHILRSPLPVSASATKQEYHKTLKEMWQTIWEESPRRLSFSQIDPNFPFNRFRKLLFTLSRKQASTIMQIRTGHIPLNKYLKRIGKSETDECQGCNAAAIETVNHFMFVCPAYDVARQELVDKIGRNHLSLVDLMETTDNAKALVTYINRTRRLRPEE
jgi:ribonuclease HI